MAGVRRISASEARKDFAEVVNKVAYGRERIVIGRRDKEFAAIVPIGDLRLLERLTGELEDRLDTEEALRVEADETDPSVPWEQVRRELEGHAVSRRREGQRAARARHAAPKRPAPPARRRRPAR